MWSKKYCDNDENIPLKDVLGNFLDFIQFHKIPTKVLMHEVGPLQLVPERIMVVALAYQVRVLCLVVFYIDFSYGRGELPSSRITYLDESHKSSLTTGATRLLVLCPGSVETVLE